MQDIRMFIEAAAAKIRGVFPYTTCQSKTVAQPHPLSTTTEGSAHFRVLGLSGVANLILERGALRPGACRGRRGACSCPVPVISLVLSKSCVRGCHREKIR